MSSKKDERPFIKMYDNFMMDKEFDSRDHFTYALIKSMTNRGFEETSVISTEIILKVLGFVINTRNKTYTRESMQRLVDKKIFKAYKDLSCTIEADEELKLSETYFFKASNEEGYFMKLYLDDFKKMILIDDKSKMKMITVYYSIISRIFDSDSSDKYTLPNVEEIEDVTGINRKTIPKYTKILMDNELIYYQTFRKSKDSTKNVYGRWEHRRFVNIFTDKMM